MHRLFVQNVSNVKGPLVNVLLGVELESKIDDDDEKKTVMCIAGG